MLTGAMRREKQKNPRVAKLTHTRKSITLLEREWPQTLVLLPSFSSMRLRTQLCALDLERRLLIAVFLGHQQ